MSNTRKILNLQIKLAKYIPYVLLLFITFYHIYIYAFAEIDVIINIYPDDSFYYFEIAKNIASGEGVTFDGIHATNGFHPLWLIIITPIYVIFNGEIIPLRIIGILTMILITIGSILGMYYIDSNFNRFTMLVSTLGILFITDNVLSHLPMEAAVAYPLGVLVLYLISHNQLCELDGTELWTLVIFGMSLALFSISRLDAILFVIIFFLYYIIKNNKKLLRKSTLIHLSAMFGPTFIIGCIYLSINLFFFGHISPVSAQVKSIEPVLFNIKIVDYILQPSLFGVVKSAALLISIIFILLYIWNFIKISNTTSVALLASMFFVVQILYYFIFTSSVMWPWYFYIVPIVLIFVLPVFTNKIYIIFRQQLQDHRPRAVLPLKTIMILLMMVFILFQYPPVLEISRENHNFLNKNRYASLEINRELPSGTYAMGDQAGSFGYFSNNPVIQLEGLVNNYEIIPYLKNDSLDEYLTKKDVDYLVSPGDRTNSTRAYVTHPRFITSTSVDADPNCVVYSGNVTVWSWDCIENATNSPVETPITAE